MAAAYWLKRFRGKKMMIIESIEGAWLTEIVKALRTFALT